MDVRLSRRDIVELFCLCRQGERSVHRALCSRWEAFRAYYDGERRGDLAAWYGKLLGLIGRDVDERDFADREALLMHVRTPGLFRVLFGRWLAGRRKEWSFALAELAFVANVMRSLLDTLGQTARPTDENLIALRMDLWACTYLIDCRCYGLPQLQRARSVEHFDATPSLRLEPLRAICPILAAGTAASARHRVAS